MQNETGEIIEAHESACTSKCLHMKVLASPYVCIYIRGDRRVTSHVLFL
jgi:hypothetical protein